MTFYLTTAEAAELAGVTQDAIRRAIREGRLAAHQRGPVYMIKRRDLLRYHPGHKRSGGRRGDEGS